jgi:hypothetical protein
MQTSYRTKALQLLEGLGGVPVRARHWAPLLHIPVERSVSVAVVKGKKPPPPQPTFSTLGTLINKVVGKYVEKKKSRKSMAPARGSMASTVSFEEDFDGEDLEDGWEGGARDERSAVFTLDELGGDFDEPVAAEVNGGRSEKQIVEGLLSHYGAEQAQQFILHNVPFGDPITVTNKQPYQKEVLTVDGGAVAWEFQVVANDLDFSAATRTGQVTTCLLLLLLLLLLYANCMCKIFPISLPLIFYFENHLHPPPPLPRVVLINIGGSECREVHGK